MSSAGVTPPRSVFTTVVLVQGLILLIALAWWSLSSIVVHTSGKPGTFAIPLGLLIGVVSYALGYLMIVRIPVLERALKTITNRLYPHFSDFGWVQIVLVSVIAGVGEELLFRGLVQTGIGEGTSTEIGIVAAALLFGLVHMSGPLYFMLAVVMGLLLGIAYEWSQSIYLVMAWHIAYDICALGVIAKYPHLVADVVPAEEPEEVSTCG